MIYTSYFGKIKKMPENFEPICISLNKPNYFHGIWFVTLAPPKDLLRWWYSISDKGPRDQAYYTEVYLNMLQQFDANAMDNRLHEIAKDKIPVLVCYEKDGFCHRHLVARWLNDHGIKCEEWKDEEIR